MTTHKEALTLARRAINNLIASSHLTDPQPWRDARQDSVDALTAIEEVLQSNEQVEPVGRIASNVKPVMRQEVMLYTDKPLPIGTALYVKEKL